VQDWLVATISGASAIGGGVVVGVSNYVIYRVQSRAAKSDELRAATANFLQAIDLITVQLRTEPTPGPVVTAVFKALRRFAPTFDANIARLQQRILAPHLQRTIESFSAASNRLLLIAPSEMLDPMGEIAELMRRAEERDAAWDKQWNEAHGKFVAVARLILGDSQPS
jgi:hypothetical protein